MAAGDPTGADLVSGTTNGDTLPEPWPPTEPEEREITFGAGIELTEGVKYAIVARASDAVDVNDAAMWQMITDGTGYGGVEYYHSDDGGSTWSSQSPAKVFFKTYAGAALRDSCSFTYTGAGIWLYSTAYWIAMVFTASSTYTITSVKLELYRVVGSTPGTITVSIRAVVGAPGAPTNPSPPDSVDPNITLDKTPLSWDASDPAADTYEIYFRESGDDWILVGEAQAGVEWTITFGTLAYGTTYEWRVDATNTEGTTTGDTWSFTCLSFAPPRISYVLISGGSGAGPYDDPPGTEGTDWAWTGENTMLTIKKLVAAANSKIWYEDL